MDPRILGFSDPTFISALSHLIGGNHGDDDDEKAMALNAPTRRYALDARAMAVTPDDVKDLASSYELVIYMLGIRSGDIKVQVEGGSMLVITGERRRKEEENGAKYLHMERRMGKLMWIFSMPDNVHTDAMTVVCKDGFLAITMKKVSPPKPKKPNIIELQVA